MPAKTLCTLFCIAIIAVGCGGGRPATAPPEDSVVLENAAVRVLEFIAKAEKKPKASQGELDVLMESLDAYAEQYQGKLLELRDAAKEMKQTYSGDDSAIKAGLKTLREKTEALAPSAAETLKKRLAAEK